jgi:hypothetical protein
MCKMRERDIAEPAGAARSSVIKGQQAGTPVRLRELDGQAEGKAEAHASSYIRAQAATHGCAGHIKGQIVRRGLLR